MGEPISSVLASILGGILVARQLYIDIRQLYLFKKYDYHSPSDQCEFCGKRTIWTNYGSPIRAICKSCGKKQVGKQDFRDIGKKCKCCGNMILEREKVEKKND